MPNVFFPKLLDEASFVSKLIRTKTHQPGVDPDYVAFVIGPSMVIHDLCYDSSLADYVPYTAKIYGHCYIHILDTEKKDVAFCTNLYTAPMIRRKGIATFLYDSIEKQKHLKIIPNEKLTKDGALFWHSRAIRSK